MIILGFLCTAPLLFYAGFLLRTAWFWSMIPRVPGEAGRLPSVSVILPARNEAARIEACVAAILHQDYPRDRYELVVVNDHSEDDTVNRAMAAAEGHPNFKVLDLEGGTGPAYKKAAVAHGVSESSGEIIVTMDADCVMGTGWLRTMAAAFDPETGLVSGPVVLEGRSVFEQFQALEFMGLIAVGAAGIASGKPTMCNGANLAYRRAVFAEVGGFGGIDHIASGDDELLMHKIAAQTSHRIRFAKHRSAIVHSLAQPTWKGFWQQRIRWVSKRRHYHRAAIGWTMVLAYLALLGFPLLAIAGLSDGRLWWFLGFNLLLKIGAEAAVLYPAAVFFDKLRLLWWLPLEQVPQIAYVLWLGIVGNRKQYEWKGRIVK
ncbi:MAG: Poly-beta,6-N-acetyl-D-glucosamine synthase [Bacteroidota bacterium]|jgi:cellulose synthase/poly-beta-1,6-N-acetylglucosamine synthase-like glycosyltransferase